MNKKNFMDLLNYYLQDLPQTVQKDILLDYEGHFAEGIKNGKTEEQIAEELGSPEDIAREFLNMESSWKRIPKSEQGQAREYQERSVWYYIFMGGLIVLFAPAIFGLFTGLFGVVLGLFGASFGLLLGGILGLIAVLFNISFGSTAIFGLPISMGFFHPITVVLFCLFLLALGVFLAILCKHLIVWLFKGGKKLIFSIRWRLER